MNTHKIILGVVVLILLYLLYVYYFSGSTDATLVKLHDATAVDVISANKLPSGVTTDYTYSIWFFVNDWNYRYGQPKVIFGRTDNNSNPAPSVTLGALSNNIQVTLETYKSANNTGSDETNSGTTHTCSIENVPLQRWTNLIISLNTRALDIYLDGKLVRTCVLPGVPKMNPSSNVYLTPDGGFSGYTSSFRYIAEAINPTQAYNIYKEGYGGSSLLGNLFNKYRIKLAFVKDGREVNSLEV
jgi:hypothetical protein